MSKKSAAQIFSRTAWIAFFAVGLTLAHAPSALAKAKPKKPAATAGRAPASGRMPNCKVFINIQRTTGESSSAVHRIFAGSAAECEAAGERYRTVINPTLTATKDVRAKFLGNN